MYIKDGISGQDKTRHDAVQAHPRMMFVTGNVHSLTVGKQAKHSSPSLSILRATDVCWAAPRVRRVEFVTPPLATGGEQRGETLLAIRYQQEVYDRHTDGCTGRVRAKLHSTSSPRFSLPRPRSPDIYMNTLYERTNIDW
mmetsp:Transcript_46614/g.116133  ORF Transcript_46614/g.116133 Transcript_46614/m.116133 type:complete len:140 (-) Transcript_46614:301-720(-)